MFLLAPALHPQTPAGTLPLESPTRGWGGGWGGVGVVPDVGKESQGNAMGLGYSRDLDAELMGGTVPSRGQCE